MESKRATIKGRLSTPLPELPSSEISQQDCLVHFSRTSSEVHLDCTVKSLFSSDSSSSSQVHFPSVEIAGSDNDSVFPKDNDKYFFSSNQISRASSVPLSRPFGFYHDPDDEVNKATSSMDRSSPTQVSLSLEGTQRIKITQNSSPNKKLNSVSIAPRVAPSSQDIQAVLQFDPCEDMLENINRCEWKLYHTVRESTETFRCNQHLNYPLENLSSVSHQGEEEECTKTQALPVSPTGDCAFRVGDSNKDPFSQLPRANSLDLAGISGVQDNSIPNRDFTEPVFPPDMDFPEDFFPGEDTIAEDEVISPFDIWEPDPPSVSTLTMTVLHDPANDMPALGVCLGDFNGQIEYFELLLTSFCDKDEPPSNPNTHNSYEFCRSGHTSMPHSANNSDVSSTANFVDSDGSLSNIPNIWGYNVARRHRHRAYIKSINALTSVAVEPYVKCLVFVNPLSSPNRITYLTANDRVIKLFQVRREGISMLHAFPYMNTVLGEPFLGSQYFVGTHRQVNILPIKEYGPMANSIQALSLSADCETFMSVEDLQVFWCHFEASDSTKPTCIVDLCPRSGVLDEMEELITASCFHPTHGSLFLLSRSSGILNVGDLRHPPSRETRQYALTTKITPQQNPTRCMTYDEILCSISAAAFLSPDHIVTRDYLSLKLWDLRKISTPCEMVPVMDYVSPYFDALYNHDSIFDRFPVSVDDRSGTVVTGLYDGAVAVWQPLSTAQNSTETIMHYRADPFLWPTSTAFSGRISSKVLGENLASAWKQSSRRPAEAELHSISSNDVFSGSEGGLDLIPEPFTNKVLSIALSPGGERFAYTSKNGRVIYMFERIGKTSCKR
ncbi:unnamed protein product [Phytomonas sp. Hart1]|nr:unnamed protein product [Phytomonas sp. Hart1]|eukprot:CCW70651.1 unnamed protein product [Phytomonas sp. isolate Hart1]